MLNSWLIFALGSAFFAAATALLGKLGVGEINSNLATLIRTAVILIMVLGIVITRGEWQSPNKLSSFGVTMLILSGIATGLSWLCYYRALQLGPASKVAPVDKLSVVMVIIGAALFLRESLTWKTAIGGLLISAGAVLMALP
jgi:bacterial/archaeal transporter family protein